ncbi:MerR family transcriptional regulator [Marinibactrum halimedae]|uniref:MerR family transcriptional regulator n=1 Tax=Marinibactrum halimedae TaxID=1444977 RepID=A0AA37WMG3_9GAMM|nr:MerR family DNA-binding transcriptional regulator [Marinibactrum halimedae]GLS25056.1 MerR family transcriptional regulator [Marinibactrum halimedae]
MSDTHTISQLAQEFGITTRAIRFYEEKGLLQPKRVGTQRVFHHSDRTRLKLILRGKRLGLSLEESAEIIGMYNPEGNNRKQLQALIQAIQLKREHLLQQQKELADLLSELDAAEVQCSKALLKEGKPARKNARPKSSTEKNNTIKNTRRKS